MKLAHFAKRVEKVVTDNSPVILTSIGVAGTVGTAILTGRASIKAVRLLDLAEENANIKTDTNIDKAKLVWTYYIPPVAVGSCTVAAIIFANRIGTRRAAAIAAAYTVTERAFEEYRDKVVETVGELKEQKIRDSVAQDKVDANPVSERTIIVGTGDVLCMEAYTGRYFMSNHETIRKAENDLREQVMNEGYASLGDLYSSLNLPRTSDCEDVGWSTDKSPRISISATVAEDGKPCLVMSYDVSPIRGYYRFH